MLHGIWRDERGMSIVVVGLGLAGFVAATTLAIDVGMFMTARSQAQNSADAGALAGATALARESFTDRTANGPAVQNALMAARANSVMGTEVNITPDDVTFPTDPTTGVADWIQVQVYRTADRGNPLSTLMGVFFGVPTANVDATATAEVMPANAMTCVKPFMLPDKWIENSDENGVADGPWTPDKTFDIVDKHGNPLPKPDEYVNWHNPGYTGYSREVDVGLRLVLRAGTGDQLNPSFYFSWKMPGDVGGDFYRENIANCNQSTITPDTMMIQEPGDMSGPTIQGIQALIDKDPLAVWDDSCLCLKNSAYTGQSPRVFPIPLYDPEVYADGKVNGREATFKIASFLGFFADHLEGNRIYGITTTIVGLVDPNAGPAPPNSFAVAIRLVK